MQLPYWDGDIDIETGQSFSPLLMAHPFEAASFCGPLIYNLSKDLMSCASELLYLNRPNFAPVGSMAPSVISELGSPAPFLLIIGYSAIIDSIIADVLQNYDSILAGIAQCTFRNGKTVVARYKTITVMSAGMFFDSASENEEEKFLNDLRNCIENSSNKRDAAIPYYAEQLGYLRVSLPYEGEEPYKLSAIAKIMSFHFEDTKKAVGTPKLIAIPLSYLISHNTLQSAEMLLPGENVSEF